MDGLKVGKALRWYTCEDQNPYTVWCDVVGCKRHIVLWSVTLICALKIKRHINETQNVYMCFFKIKGCIFTFETYVCHLIWKLCLYVICHIKKWRVWMSYWKNLIVWWSVTLICALNVWRHINETQNVYMCLFRIKGHVSSRMKHMYVT